MDAVDMLIEISRSQREAWITVHARVTAPQAGTLFTPEEGDAMSIEVSTREYEFSHGKKPRGYGNWAFFFDGATDVGAAKWFTGKFSEAKKMAVAWAASKKHTKVEVGS